MARATISAGRNTNKKTKADNITSIADSFKIIVHNLK